MSISLSFRTEEESRDQLDAIAESMDRNRNWVINEAIKNFIELNKWQIAQIEEGLDDVKHGRTHSMEEMREQIARHHARRTAAAKKRK